MDKPKLHKLIEMKRDYEIELATTRIGIKKANRHFFTKLLMRHLLTKERGYEEAISQINKEIMFAANEL